MKQNITQQDLLQLNEKQIKALFTYWWKSPPIKKNPNTPYARCEYDTGYLLDLPMLSIGDMIQYLTDVSDTHIILQRYLRYKDVKIEHMTWEINNCNGYIDPELCDCLWELTKEYLGQ